jgi:alanine racemase
MTARVDLGPIRSNFAALRSLAGDRTVMACIKSTAYGHGLVPVARCLEDAGVPWLTLGSLDGRSGGARPCRPWR